MEIGKRDIYSLNRVSQERADLSYNILAVDFLHHSKVQALLLSVSSSLASGVIHSLPVASFGLTNVSRALRYMSQARHVGKIVVTGDIDCEAREVGKCVFLGGNGGLGKVISTWMTIFNRTTHLVLCGRNPRPADGSVSLSTNSLT